MHVPGVGTFRFAGGEERVWAYPEDGASDALVEETFRRAVLPLALQARGVQVLHASAVAGRRGVVALAAVSATGKSTTAFALSGRGYPLWADDALAFEVRDGSVAALPLPFSLRLRPESVRHFEWDGRAEVSTPEPAALCAVAILERSAQEPVLERLGPDALPLLVDHAYVFDADREADKRAMVEQYMELISTVPVYRVRLTPGLDSLPHVLDELEREVLS